MYKCAKKLLCLAFILVIPTLITACGGAASDGSSTPPDSTTNKPDADSSQAIHSTSNSMQSSTISKSSIQSSNVSKSSQQSSSETSSLSSTGTSKSTSSADSSSASTHKITTIRWSHPNKRESGQFLELDEIAGYEIRYKQSQYDNYTYISLAGNRETSFTTDLISANSIVEIAVYDTNRLYSMFTPISAEPE